MKKVMMAALLFSALNAAHALEVAGVNLSDKTELAGKSLQLNGAGVRKKLVFDVYIAALYCVTKSNDAIGLMQSTQPRRMQLTMLRNVDAQTLADALTEGLQANLSEAQLTGFAPKIKELQKILLEAKVANKGDVINLDFLPGQGTNVFFRGKNQGLIAGDDFAAAILAIWLGTKPVQEGLKLKLLGKE